MPRRIDFKHAFLVDDGKVYPVIIKKFKGFSSVEKLLLTRTASKSVYKAFMAKLLLAIFRSARTHLTAALIPEM